MHKIGLFFKAQFVDAKKAVVLQDEECLNQKKTVFLEKDSDAKCSTVQD